MSFTIQDANATTRTISDGPSCVAIGGAWNGVSTCTVMTLTVNSGDALFVSSGIILSNIGVITNSGAFINNPGGTITNNSGGEFNNNSGAFINNYKGAEFLNNFGDTLINNSGAFIFNSGLIDNGGLINSYGTITNSLAITNSGTISNPGILTNNSGTIDNISGGIIYNSGTLTNKPGGTITNYSGGEFNNISGGITNNSGGIITNGGQFNNNSGGTIRNNSGGQFKNNSGGTITNLGVIDINPFDLTNNSGGTINNSGIIDINGGGSINNYGTINNKPGGTITSSANIINSGTINNSGTIKKLCDSTYIGPLPIGNPLVIFTCQTILNPSTGPVGTLVTVTGSSFPPSSTVTINFDMPTVATTPATITTTVSGTFSATFTVPSSTAGPHTVTASSGVNFGLATFTVTTPAFPIIQMSDTTVSAGVLISSPRQLVAEYITPTSVLVGKPIDSITIKLQKVGAATGTAQIGVFNTDLSVKKLFGTIDVSTISTTASDYEFKLLSTDPLYTISSGDRIGFKYTLGSSTAGVNVTPDKDAAEPFDGTNSYRVRYVTVWVVTTAEDMNMILKQTHG